MTEIFEEITQGDPLYLEVAFLDPYGNPIDLSDWDIAVAFRLSFAGGVLEELNTANAGVGFVDDDAAAGVIRLSSDGSAYAGIDINPRPRNGELVPSRTIVGDVRLTPPAGVQLVQGAGARTSIFLKIQAAVT